MHWSHVWLDSLKWGVTFDLSLNWLSRNGSYNLTQCHALLPTSHARDFWAWVCSWLFWFCKNLHHHFHGSLVFELCDFVSFDTVGRRGFFFFVVVNFSLLSPKINNLRIFVVVNFSLLSPKINNLRIGIVSMVGFLKTKTREILILNWRNVIVIFSTTFKSFSTLSCWVDL